MTGQVFTEYDRGRVWQRINTLPFRFRRSLARLTFAEADKVAPAALMEKLNKRIAYVNRVIEPAREKIDGISFDWWQLKNKEAARDTAAKKAAVVHCAMVEMAQHAKGDYSDKLQFVYCAVVELITNQHPEIITPVAETDEEKECGLLRMASQKWWERKLQKIRKRHREYTELAALEVGTKQSPYCSRESVAEFIRDQLEFKSWAAGREMVNESGESIEMQKAIDSGMANPENMRVELMKRIAGLEDYAEEIGAKGAFITLTAPGKYHRKRGQRYNRNWNGSSPKETQAYMVKLWAQARAALKRVAVDGVPLSYFGVRVVEPHKDGTPHWHLMLWATPKALRIIKKVLFAYFTAEDKAELWARWHNRKALYKAYRKRCAIYRYYKKKGKDVKRPKLAELAPWSPRFLWVDIESTPRGEDGRREKSAAGYIAKYISKNINGAGCENMICAKTGQLIGLSLAQVKAWASLWGIRQFQFQGCDPITVYRELRRVRQPLLHERLEKVRAAAESNNFVDFIRAIKAVNDEAEATEQAPVKLAYSVTPYGNEYGEATKKVKGVGCSEFTAVTRAESWTVRRKAQLFGRVALTWSSGNNCTPVLDSYHGALFDDDAKKALGRGCTVNVAGQRWRLRQNRLYEVRE